jgi:hypothetical protein
MTIGYQIVIKSYAPLSNLRMLLSCINRASWNSVAYQNISLLESTVALGLYV